MIAKMQFPKCKLHQNAILAKFRGKIKDRMERAKLESELENMQRLVDHIPPEVLAELKRQRHTTKER